MWVNVGGCSSAGPSFFRGWEGSFWAICRVCRRNEWEGRADGDLRKRGRESGELPVISPPEPEWQKAEKEKNRDGSGEEAVAVAVPRGYQQCTACRRVLRSCDAVFYRHPKTRSGFDPRCRECRVVYDRGRKEEAKRKKRGGKTTENVGAVETSGPTHKQK